MSIAVDTNYPFSDNVKTTIITDKAFTFYIRVPTWINKQASIKVGSAAATAFTPDATTKLQKVSVPAGTTIISLVLSADITVENRLHGSVAIHRGPFNYALDLPKTSKKIKTLYPVSFSAGLAHPEIERVCFYIRRSLALRTTSMMLPPIGATQSIPRLCPSTLHPPIRPSSRPSSTAGRRPSASAFKAVA